MDLDFPESSMYFILILSTIFTYVDTVQIERIRQFQIKRTVHFICYCKTLFFSFFFSFSHNFSSIETKPKAFYLWSSKCFLCLNFTSNNHSQIIYLSNNLILFSIRFRDTFKKPNPLKTHSYPLSYEMILPKLRFEYPQFTEYSNIANNIYRISIWNN